MIYAYMQLVMRAFIKLIKALFDPQQVKIVKLLEQRVMCVCELQASLGISQPTVSNHLRL
jgi:ArsR family transcriptional regulator